MNLIQRISQCKTEQDYSDQMAKAKRSMMRKRKESKRQDITLAEKIDWERKAKEDEHVLREMRKTVFDFEDHANAGTLDQFIEIIKELR
jgi:antitoxin component HigA of HigAB toxin-antitoxin module